VKNHLVKLYTTSIFTLIIAIAPKIAMADSSDYGGGWTVPSLDTSSSIVKSAIDREIFDRQILKNSDSPSVSTGNHNNFSKNSTSVSSKQLMSLDFRSSSQLRQQNISRFIAKLRANNAPSSGQIEQISPANFALAIDKSMADVGLKSNNIADAYAVYWTTAWLGSRGRNEDLPKAQMIAVRNQAANALLSNSKLTSATNRQKQELAEALILQAILISTSVSSVKSDPMLLNQAKTAISQGAKSFGLNFDLMTLTDRGFQSTK
jgi:hypothetical protein